MSVVPLVGRNEIATVPNRCSSTVKRSSNAMGEWKRGHHYRGGPLSSLCERHRHSDSGDRRVFERAVYDADIRPQRLVDVDRCVERGAHVLDSPPSGCGPAPCPDKCCHIHANRQWSRAHFLHPPPCALATEKCMAPISIGDEDCDSLETWPDSQSSVSEVAGVATPILMRRHRRPSSTGYITISFRSPRSSRLASASSSSAK